jgi:hypothetical protein
MDGGFLATMKSRCDQVATGGGEGHRAAHRRYARGRLRAGEQAVCGRGVTGERRGPFVWLKTRTTT